MTQKPWVILKFLTLRFNIESDRLITLKWHAAEIRPFRDTWKIDLVSPNSISDGLNGP